MKNFDSTSTLMETNATPIELAMSLSSRSNVLTERIARIQQVAAVMTVAKIARLVTVKIESAFGTHGSGVIINRQGNVYTVLTAHRVVEQTGIQYTIGTYNGNNYAVTKAINFQQRHNEPDLALVQFSSPNTYLVGPLGSSDHAGLGAEIYVAGYPQSMGTRTEEFEFTNGMIIDRPTRKLLYYSAPIGGGMSGAPVFNASSQVIAIHVAKDLERERGTTIEVAVPVIDAIALLD
ncbi:MAG TPA: serine protease [Chroococcales cyanobacterium]